MYRNTEGVHGQIKFGNPWPMASKFESD